MKRKFYSLLLAGACLFGVSVYAHHSFPATYVMSEEITLEGELVAFMYRNPHSVIHMVVTDDAGESRRYAVEWGAPTFLGGAGITRTTFKSGDPVIIIGNPARDPDDNRIHMISIERLSDGLKWPTDPQGAHYD